jgi:CubicO group peptidase (beta-lactamase class C family)
LAGSAIEDKINLNDKINKYYNFPFKNNTEINFKSLANHTSGLERLPSNLDLSKADPTNPFSSYTGSTLESYLKSDLNLNGKAGEKYEYSNLGFGLPGYTLSILYRRSYTVLLKEIVFSKYQMTSSLTNRNTIENRFVKGLDAQGNETVNWDFEVFSGAGGILSTVTDMAKFATARFDAKNQELTLTRTTMFTVNENLKVGLGWNIIKTGSGKDIYKHNGGTGGYSSSIALNIESKNSAVLLSNLSTFNPDMGNIDELCFGLLGILDKK